jgi:hypothetical protein
MSEKKDKTTRDQALRVARMLGCQGAHETDAGWMPCSSHEEYEGIKKGKEEYLKVRASNNKKPLPKMVQRTKRLETKSGAYYENRADAVSISKINGCNGVRTVMLGGKRYYVPCQPKGWEKLDESPITGIATLPGGGLVTGSFSGKSDEEEMDEKGFVNFVSRSTDPDTFSDPESARIRARNLGCIGIRRYTARDGKLVWLPCTNVSDYNRVTGIRGDNSPINNPRRQGSGFKKKSEMDEKALGRSIGGYRRMFKPIGGVGALEDGDGDGFATGADGEDNIPVAKVPKPKTTKPAPKKTAPKKKAPKKKLTRAQQRDLDAWNDQVWRNQRERRLANARGYVYAPDADRLAPGAVDWDKAQEVEGHWMSTVDSLEKNSGISKDDKDYAKKKRAMMRRAYVETAKKFNLSPKQVQQHMNEVSRQERRPKIITPESLGVPDIMKPRGKKPSEKDAISDGIISYKGVPKPKKKPPTVTSTDINNLAVMVRKNNAKAKTSAKTNLRDLKVVFVRGLTDGGREEANKRVSKFLSLLNSDKPKDVKYSEDNDLLPIDHPWKNRKTAKKWADFEEGEYGVKYAGGCCPKVVKRYRSK